MFIKYGRIINIVAGMGILISCNSTKHTGKMPNRGKIQGQSATLNSNDQFLEGLMSRNPGYFEKILSNRTAWNVQILYTQINRDKKGEASFKTYNFNTDPTRYFYPASTVKLPIVLLALQKLNELKKWGVNRNSTMTTEDLPGIQSGVYNDPTAIDGRPTIEHYIEKILMVSDNDAYNRLYEFLGQDYINEQLHRMGYKDVQILHRLNLSLSDKQNRKTNAIKFFGKDGKLLYEQAVQNNTKEYQPRKEQLGNAYYANQQLIEKPMDFSRKNRISLEDLHQILAGLFFPNMVGKNKTFNITEEDKQFVFKYMSQYPTESVYPAYGDDSAYWPAYGKFLLFGADKGTLPKNIRIFNKEGDAYGHMLDVSYIVDYEHQIEFLLSAVVYCNADGILNDDKYDYDSIGLPFMKHLGQVIYDYELKRERQFSPDLSGLIFKYDK